jgi:hypothetical protein
MLLCPGCKSEYEKGMKICPDCNLELAEVNLITCQNCGENVESSFKYCLHCGLILDDSISDIHDECENHPGIDSIGICVICGKPVCDTCAKLSEKRVFCEQDEHLKIYEDYVLVSVCTTDYEAQMMKSVIEMSGIDCILFSQKDHVFSTNIGDTAIVNVMVPKEDANKALEIVERMNNEKGDEITEDENE